MNFELTYRNLSNNISYKQGDGINVQLHDNNAYA
jgi:hypothetical protein